MQQSSTTRRKSFQSILVIYYSTQSCKNLRNNCSLRKCFHAFEIPPNSWFLAGNISFQSILVFITQLNLAKSESSKKKVLMEKLTQQLLSAPKVLSCIRNTAKFLVFGRKYFVPVNIGHLLINSILQKLTQQLLSAQKCFHAFEIPPNSWFVAGKPLSFSKSWSELSIIVEEKSLKKKFEKIKLIRRITNFKILNLSS